MEDKGSGGDLGNGPLPQGGQGTSQTLKPNAVVYVNDREHGKERIGVHYPGQHGYQYQDVDGMQPPQT